MIRYGELIQALNAYTHRDISHEISDAHYRLVITLAIRKNRQRQQWNVLHLCAILLYITFNDGQLRPSQLTYDGLQILDWGEVLVEENSALIDEIMAAKKTLSLV